MQTHARRKAQTTPRPDRKQAILLAAEKLFAQRGYHAVSIRQIASEAQVPLALVGYYFGQKHELFHAIFASWSGTIAERLDALAEIGREPAGEPRLRRIVRAFVEPVLRLRASPEGEYYALLITQGLGPGQREADSVLRDFFDPLATAFIDALHEALREEVPHASRSTAAWCYQFALGTLLHHISDTRVERLSQGANPPHDASAAPLLIDFIVHGIRGAVLALPRPATRKSP